MIKRLQSETIKNYAGAIAILLGALPGVGSLVVSVVTAYRGEPYAEKTWMTLRKQVDEQTSAINAVNLKLVKLEALQEGLQLGRLQGELEALQRQYERLRKIAKKDQSAGTSPKPLASPLMKEETQHLEETKSLLKEAMKQQSKKAPSAPRPLAPLPKNP